MKFDVPVRTTHKIITHDEYFDGICPFCSSTDMITRTSRYREIPDLGSPVEEVIVRVEVATYFCKDCKMYFSPEHPLYPPKFEYSRAIIEYALARSHYANASGNAIAHDLALLHQVHVAPKTIYSWIDHYGTEFTKTKTEATPQKLPKQIQSITVDGTFLNLGKQLIGKKKDVESLSVIKIADNRYWLMW